jgi:hypothetical protein
VKEVRNGLEEHRYAPTAIPSEFHVWSRKLSREPIDTNSTTRRELQTYRTPTRPQRNAQHLTRQMRYPSIERQRDFYERGDRRRGCEESLGLHVFYNGDKRGSSEKIPSGDSSKEGNSCLCPLGGKIVSFFILFLTLSVDKLLDNDDKILDATTTHQNQRRRTKQQR